MGTTLKRVQNVFPTIWDAKQLERCAHRWRDRYEIELTEPTHEACPFEFDVLSFIEREADRGRGRVGGVFSSSDYPGAAAAAAIASRLGLAGPSLEAVMRCAHKYYSRLAQQDAEPAATPRFWLLDPSSPAGGPSSVRFPCFVKPVKGSFSVLSGRVEGQEELERFLSQEAAREYAELQMRMFNDLLASLGGFEIDGRHFIAEELLEGEQVTVEGFEAGGRIEFLGVVDSILDPDTGSFVRFEYPSSLPSRVQSRMRRVARRVLRRVGLRSSLFNMELAYDAGRDRVSIIEINPRMCGQFADLYEKVDGTNSYEVALAIAAGERPRLDRRKGPHAMAASVPLRVFEPVRVAAAPDPERIREVEADLAGTLAWSECRTGQTLEDFQFLEDGRSARYAIVNVGGSDRADLLARSEEARRRLGFAFSPLGGSPPRRAD